jgi:uncharacterized membrane protein YkvA (DUF1232 family)
MFARILRRIGLAGTDIAVLWYACRHPDTPRFVKMASIALLAYVISPIDLIPDALPVLGWIDDAALLAFGMPALIRMLPRTALNDARVASARLWSRWSFGRK